MVSSAFASYSMNRQFIPNLERRVNQIVERVGEIQIQSGSNKRLF